MYKKINRIGFPSVALVYGFIKPPALYAVEALIQCIWWWLILRIG
ncbi:MAG: hypothetical protein M5T52_24575 [Ignavibacteriaceae bacterium]|nr:hypothetical protein [Ignavibacteriaceae bacterium]